jgi:hypothetical protein
MVAALKTDVISYETYCNLLPSSALCTILAKTLPNFMHKQFALINNNIIPFKKVDNASAALPILMIYPTQETVIGDSWYLEGTLYWDFVFPGGAMIRQRSTEIAKVMAESTVFLVLKNMKYFEYLKYGFPDSDGNPTGGYFPALVELGEQISIEYAEANSLISEQETVTIRLRVNYKVDTVQWWEFVQEKLGNNTYDPCQHLYDLWEKYTVEINLHSAEENIDGT